MSTLITYSSRMAVLVLLSWVSVHTTLFAADDAPPVVKFSVNAFKVIGDNPLDAARTQATLAPFLGDHEGLEGLLAAAAELESVILQAGYSFHRVILPPQTMDQDQIQLQVVVFKLAHVAVTGNTRFSDKNIRASLPGLKPGKVPDTRELARELIIANNHPSKKVTIRLKHSKVVDSIDAELAVKDRRPWSVFAGVNNIGTDETGEYRITGGLQHTNLTGHDDTLTVSYTTSPGHFGDVKQYGVNYRLPVYPLSGSLSLYYSYSDVNSGTIQQVFDVSGAGRFAGGSFTYTFRNWHNYRHRLILGMDDKIFDNNIDFQGTPLGVDVRSRPLTLSYSGEWRLARANLRFQLGYVRNLPGGSINDNPTYAAARQGARQTWEALRFAASGSYSLPRGWLLTAMMNGQYSDEPLISGEQFGLGGANSVRGFEERGITGDRGIRVTLEAWTPPLLYDVRLLGFIDSGHARTVEPAVGQLHSDTVMSLGLGVRWQWSDKLSVSFDYGHQVNAARTPNAGGVKSHLNIFYRF